VKSFVCCEYKKYSQGGDKLARSNFQFKKRQKELARKKKQEQKRQNKIDKKNTQSEDSEALAQIEENKS
jgi:hypothetical protein